MKRRTFLRNASAAAAISCLTHRLPGAQDSQQPISARLAIDESAALATVPQDFIGLSYESAQLADPAFFSAENAALIALFRELGDQGVLRLGGGTSDFTAFTTDEQAGPSSGSAVGPDTSKNVKTDTPIMPRGLRNLRAFLDATGWRCLYGLNLGRGPVPRAAEEAFAVQSILGPRLVALQLGNEPDAWRNRYRPSTWSYPDYWKEWSPAYAAIAARVPGARFAGPDAASKMDFVTGFAADVKKSAHDVVMLTSHYYRMGPAGSPGMTIDKLLTPDPRLDRDLEIAMAAARSAGLSYRMSEGNSCWNGGQPGVSDTYASALWAAGFLLDLAAGGCAGANLHGGGNGFYTPIAGSVATGFARRPEFFGMKLIQPFIGARLVTCSMESDSDRIRAYAARKDTALLLLLINQTDRPANVHAALPRCKRQWHLSGPSIDAKEGVALRESPSQPIRGGVLHVPAFSAILLEA